MDNSKIKSILLHNFSDQEALSIMRLIKANYPDKDSVAFAMTTENNKKMVVSDLLEHLEAEHQAMAVHQKTD